jgi:two-component system, NtrC family, nitrogen regulation response regulator GlnG
MADNENKSFNLAKAIEDFEDYFFNEKGGELYKFVLGIIEKPVIENVLRKTEGNQLKAAKILGINRNTLHAKIKKLNIYVEKFK